MRLVQSRTNDNSKSLFWITPVLFGVIMSNFQNNAAAFSGSQPMVTYPKSSNDRNRNQQQQQQRRPNHNFNRKSSSALHFDIQGGGVDAAFDAVWTAVRSFSTLKVASLVEHDVSNALFTAGSSISDPTRNPLMQKETQAVLLNDMSRIALDFTHIFGEEESLAYQGAELVGYFLSMWGDFTPDQQIAPEELVFKGFMLAAAASALKDTVMSMAWTGNNGSALVETVLSYREKKAYDLLFAPVGVKRHQFDDLLHNGVIDWVTIEPGVVISNHTTDPVVEQCYAENPTSAAEECEEDLDDDEYVYWLYKGWVEVDVENSDGKMIEYPKVSRLDVGLGLIGEMSLTRRIERQFIAANEEEGMMTMYHPAMIVKAGSDNTKRDTQLLRMNTKKLMERSDADDELAHSIHLLLIMGMQDKLNALMKFSGIDDCYEESCPVF